MAEPGELHRQMSVDADLITQESERSKKIKFNAFEINDDGTITKMEPFGVNGNRHPLIADFEGNIPKLDDPPPQKEKAVEVPKINEEVGLPPISIVSTKVAKSRAKQSATETSQVPELRAELTPEFSIEIISDAIDIPIPCFQVHLDWESLFLSIIVPRHIKFKFTAGKECTIRVDDNILQCWFSGVKVPLRMMEADVMSFVINSPNENEREL